MTIRYSLYPQIITEEAILFNIVADKNNLLNQYN